MIRVLAFALLSSVSCKTYERCELAKELKYAFEVSDSEVGTWVCIAEHESQYNTSAIGMVNGDGSNDHGIFQINDEFWCSPPGKGWACGLSCAELEDDDIEDDFNCAKRIFKEHKILSGDGFNAWAVYKPYCQGERAQKYVDGCFNETDGASHPKKKVPTKKVYPWLVSKPSSTTSLPEKTNEDLLRSFTGRNDSEQNKGTKAMSSKFSTVAPPDYESTKTVLTANSVSASSTPLFSSITSAFEPITNRQTLSRFGNNIPATDGNILTSEPLNSFRYTSTSTKNPSLSSVSGVTNVGITSGKLDPSSSKFNSLTPISESILGRQISASQSGNGLPPLTVLPRTKPAAVSTTIFPETSEATPLFSVRTVIGPKNRFISLPERNTFTAPKETSPSNQRIESQLIQKEPTFIVNGVAWV